MKTLFISLFLFMFSACNAHIEKEKLLCEIKQKMFCEVYSSLSDNLLLEVKDKIKKTSVESIGNYHSTAGMQIRNQFDLWGNNEITKYFNERGISHPDMMSHVMLQGFIFYLNGQPADMDMLSKEVAKLPPPPPPPPPDYPKDKQ